MKDNDWHQKPGVRVLEGRWQDLVEKEDFLALGGFDVIYTDTFSENYRDLHQFFEHLPDLLSGSNARFSFFHGLGATSEFTHLILAVVNVAWTDPLFYDVYTRISELHLAEIGLDVQWSDVDVRPPKYEERWARSREYFTLPTYRLPLAYLHTLP